MRSTTGVDLPGRKFQSAPGLEAGRCEMAARFARAQDAVSIRARP